MRLEYNEQQLKKMLETFYTLTNASICVFDCDFKTICAYGEMPCFCSEIRKRKDLLEKCLSSDKQFAEVARDSKKSITYTCHAGIVETISPVFLDGILLGYIIFGGLKDLENVYSNDAKIKEVCKNYELNYKKFTGLYEKLSSFNHRKLNAYIEILNLCIKNVLTEKMLTPNHTLFSNKIINYIREHYTEKITIKSLCHKFGISEKPLYAIIKKSTDKTVNDFIIDLRIEKAKTLLSTTDLSISKISDAVGFDDYNYFIRIFKKRTCVTPLKYRKLFL